MILDWPDILTITLGAGVAGYYLHAGISRPSATTARDIEEAVRKATEASPLIALHDVRREIERVEARLLELRTMERNLAGKQSP